MKSDTSFPFSFVTSSSSLVHASSSAIITKKAGYRFMTYSIKTISIAWNRTRISKTKIRKDYVSIISSI
jgi:hypothetical protein